MINQLIEMIIFYLLNRLYFYKITKIKKFILIF